MLRKIEDYVIEFRNENPVLYRDIADISFLVLFTFIVAKYPEVFLGTFCIVILLLTLLCVVFYFIDIED